MSRNRFLLILSNFHIADNDADHRLDKLFKVRPLLSMLQDNFAKYKPERDISFDEGTCPFKERVHFRVYNPMKPNKFGIKLFQLCEASSGYCVGLDVYHGSTDCVQFVNTLDNDYDDRSQTSKIVLGMMAKNGFLGKGHHIYMDNYYTSPELFDVLDSYDTYACSTVRISRKEVPRIFSMVRLRQGDVIFRRRNNLLALKYYDKRAIHMLSTIHEAKFMMTDRLNRHTNKPISKPIAIVHYIQTRGA